MGAAWGRKTFQADVVAVNDDEHAILLGECKWTAGALGRSVVRGLMEKAAAVLPEGVGGWKVYYAFFSKEGFTAEAKKEVTAFPTFWIDLPALDQGLHTG